MLVEEKPKYCYNDIMIMPCKVSKISSRSEINLPSTLPLFTAPMDNVVGVGSYEKYKENGIIPILPRSVSLDIRLENKNGWSAYGLKEFEENFCDPENQLINHYVLIDVANGHMKCIYDLVKKAKQIWGQGIVVMVGNIANPQTYEYAERSGVDYIRVGIGAGHGCVTSSNSSVHYPMASLIAEIKDIKDEIQGKCKIVADGGIRGYSDIIKALALGADYVMVGSVFAQMLEAEGPIESNWAEEINKNEVEYLGEGKFIYRKHPIKLSKKFYGMASKYGQISIGGRHTKTSEGCLKTLEIKYTMSSWVKNMRDYLRSAMSYIGIADLQFMECADCIVVSPSTQESINK